MTEQPARCNSLFLPLSRISPPHPLPLLHSLSRAHPAHNPTPTHTHTLSLTFSLLSLHFSLSLYPLCIHSLDSLAPPPLHGQNKHPHSPPSSATGRLGRPIRATVPLLSESDGPDGGSQPGRRAAEDGCVHTNSDVRLGWMAREVQVGDSGPAGRWWRTFWRASTARYWPTGRRVGAPDSDCRLGCLTRMLDSPECLTRLRCLTRMLDSDGFLRCAVPQGPGLGASRRAPADPWPELTRTHEQSVLAMYCGPARMLEQISVAWAEAAPNHDFGCMTRTHDSDT